MKNPNGPSVEEMDDMHDELTDREAKRLLALAPGSASLQEPKWSEHNHTLTPVCPYCGHKRQDAWEINFGPGMEGETEIMCGGCERDYVVSRGVIVDYSTAKLPNTEVSDSHRR